MLVVVWAMLARVAVVVFALMAIVLVRVLVLVDMSVGMCVRMRMAVLSYPWMFVLMLVFMRMFMLVLMFMFVVALHDSPPCFANSNTGLRRLLWKSPVQKICDGCPYQVDHGDESGHVPVASGPRTGGLEEAIESFQPCV